ncbi:MAG: FAD-dependent oxidoreductase [Akkermansiaceae bacterium]|nr:FAD-dependent oxidoreductase [Verrucomicrobiales bacterium]
MNLTSSHPFWSVTNGLPANYPSLQHDVSCDTVVIGGGITGALVAFHLAEAGLKTLLIDKRDIGTGSTSASTALLQYEIDVPLRELIQKVGPVAATRSYQLCRGAIGKLEQLAARLKIDCGFERKPSLFLARHQREIPELREEFQLRRKMKIELEFYDAAAVRKRFPFSRPAALYSRDGGQVDPHRLTHGLLAAGKRIGLEVCDRTEMARLEQTRRGVRVRTKNGFVITARRAVIAAGFESKALLKGDAGTLKSTYALISEPLPKIAGWRQQCLIWESGSPYLYLRTTTEGRVIVGGEDEDFVNAKRRDALISRKTRTLVEKFGRLFPDVPLEVAFSWAGTFGETKDGLAYIGVHPRYPHTYFALGYGGNGITFSFIAAEIIRDARIGRKNRDAPIFRFGR